MVEPEYGQGDAEKGSGTLVKEYVPHAQRSFKRKTGNKHGHEPVGEAKGDIWQTRRGGDDGRFRFGVRRRGTGDFGIDGWKRLFENDHENPEIGIRSFETDFMGAR